MITEISPQMIRDALDRISRSPDGELLYRYLQKTLMGVTAQDAPDCALQRNEGRRSFASELMGFMAEGQRSGSAVSVTFSLAGPRAVSRSRGIGRRISADTRIAGWDTDAEPEPDADSGAGSGK